MQSRSKLDRLLWSLQQLMKIDAMNLVILVIFVLIGWSLISDNIANPARYLPSPIAVALSSVDMLVKGLLPSYFSDTLLRLIIGSAIGLAAGIPFGLLLGLNRTVADMFHPMLNFFQSVSGIAIFPIVVIWYGNSDVTVLIVILYTSFFPIAFNVLSGVREIPLRYINAARTLGASRFQVMKDVLFPGAMPHIATGSRLSIGFAWRCLL